MITENNFLAKEVNGTKICIAGIVASSIFFLLSYLPITDTEKLNLEPNNMLIINRSPTILVYGE